MAVKIRLARGGRKGIPYYAVVVANDQAPRDGNYLEQIGTYDPLLPKDHKDRVKINNERYNYWFQTGAKPTETVAKLYRNLNNIPHPTKTYPPKKESKKASS